MHHVFTADQGVILVRLILFHLLTDFVLQPDSWVKNRNQNHYRSPKLYWHGIIAGAGAYLAIWDWAAYPIFVVVALTHISLDLWKSYPKKKSTLEYFVLDQFLHIAVSVICWLSWIAGFEKFSYMIGVIFKDYKILLYALGYIICVFPSGYIVDFSTARWRKQIRCEENDSLSEVGKWIGIIERILVLTLVYTGTYANVGLILAAKSILRFSDMEARKNSEYVLIGTMISFTLAIVTGILIKFLL